MNTPFLIIVAAASILLSDRLEAASDVDQLSIRGAWESTSAAPLSARNHASIAWNGSEIFVFGGIEFACPPLASCMPPSKPPLSDGAAYDPRANTWRSIADAPMGIISSEAAVVEAGIFLLAFTSYTERSMRLLRYRPDQDIWDEFNLPENVFNMGIVAFDNDILLYSRTDENGPAGDWRLSLTTGDWSQIADDPLSPSFGREFIAHNNDLYLFGHALVPSPGGESGPSYLRAARFRGGQWKRLPTSDSIGLGPVLIADDQLVFPQLGCADGGEVNNYGRCIAYGAVFDTSSDTWRELPNAPARGEKYVNSSGGIADGMLVLFEPGYPALDASIEQWFIFPELDTDPFTQRHIQAAGPYGFAFGGASFSGSNDSELLNDAWIWMP